MIENTARKLVGGAADLIMQGGYNGFSYADLSARFGLRKPSIHHHFPSKVDLVVAVVETARAAIATQVEAMERDCMPGLQQLYGYVGYWEKCITDRSAPFCIAAVLAAELPTLPPAVAASVRAYFDDLTRWLTRALSRAAEEGSAHLPSPAAVEAEIFMGTVYGAMLTARAFEDPSRFKQSADAAFDRLRVQAPVSRRPEAAA